MIDAVAEQPRANPQYTKREALKNLVERVHDTNSVVLGDKTVRVFLDGVSPAQTEQPAEWPAAPSKPDLARYTAEALKEKFPEITIDFTEMYSRQAIDLRRQDFDTLQTQLTAHAIGL